MNPNTIPTKVQVAKAATMEFAEKTMENSLLVRFELVPADGGTLLKMTESNFDGRGLDDARVLADYEDHTKGWSEIMPRLAPYAESLAGRGAA